MEVNNLIHKLKKKNVMCQEEMTAKLSKS